ncbi:thioredoxin family protein [Aeoliella mucimassa]|uniref:Thiol:disulfide interchange protein DsbD n=1 Tax=Aeoliella mucimassa TaxID=2527972 RepID=A0A518AVT5_9BACT|nr:thioredoxin family protein [Aeoliella mucimassa]QDU58847.1 Thiol:disulfide interchange protein DsbD precursor [Aeoliella mucimassa]
MSETPSPSTTEEDSADASSVSKKKSPFWRGFWLTFLVVSLAYAWYCFYVPNNDIAWAGNFAAAEQQAAASGKPMVLYFTGQWCVPCRVMKRQVWADDEVKTAVNADFVPVMIDVDDPQDESLVARYNVRGTPITIITDSAGNALRWRVGGISKAEFLELLREPTPTAAEEG